ncbi:MAG TPA: HEAT repeat domain-containing protein [Gemmatimonadales bacterium]|nr:HEAT repeat domain-containing protein [Gemmatimonadales bacterium]
MTDVSGTELALPPTQVEELLSLIGKALRAVQLYLPNNPVYQRAIENVRVACRKIWEATGDLVLDVQESDLRWEGNVVYHNEQKNESIAWTLFKDGVRTVTLRPGVEENEIVRFMQVLHQARTLQADAADDLLTLLWQEDFQFLAYTFQEVQVDQPAAIEAEEPASTPAPVEVQQQVQQEAPPQREVVSADEFDTTLYFLEDQEIGYLQDEVEREYAQDLRHNVLSLLFDLLELQSYGSVRAELIAIVENFIPYLLGSGDFHSVAFVLRQLREVVQRAKDLIPEHREALLAIPTRLSQPEALSQLLQALDEATAHPSEEELGELFRELKPEAIVTLAGWVSRLGSEQVRTLVKRSAERLAAQNPAEVLKALASSDSATALEMVRLAGRLRLATAPEGMGPLLERGNREMKLAVVDALTSIASPIALRLLEGAVEDPERDVRIAAVRFLSSRGHRGAFQRIEAAVLGGKLRHVDLTEKIAFFEAFGALAGGSGVGALERILVPRGLLARREDAGIRACAAMALGKIRTPEARTVLERAAQDREALVRNAVSRALREMPA